MALSSLVAEYRPNQARGKDGRWIPEGDKSSGLINRFNKHYEKFTLTGKRLPNSFEKYTKHTTKRVAKRDKKLCYKNSLDYHKETGADLYVGVVIEKQQFDAVMKGDYSKGLYVSNHAWNMDSDKRIVDTTLGKSKDIYLGVKIPTKRLRTASDVRDKLLEILDGEPVKEMFSVLSEYRPNQARGPDGRWIPEGMSNRVSAFDLDPKKVNAFFDEYAWKGGVTEDEITDLFTYAGDTNYQIINNLLRTKGEQVLRNDEKYKWVEVIRGRPGSLEMVNMLQVIDGIDSMMSKIQMKHEVQTHRHAKLSNTLVKDMLENLRFKDAGYVSTTLDAKLFTEGYKADVVSYANNKNAVLNPNQISEALRKRLSGDTVYDLNPETGKIFAKKGGPIDVHFNIKVPKGANAIPVDSYSHKRTEYELLLPRDSEFKITGYGPMGDQGMYIEAELVQ